VNSDQVEDLVESYLCADEDSKLAGLGARDTLRLEAGLFVVVVFLFLFFQEFFVKSCERVKMNSQ